MNTKLASQSCTISSPMKLDILLEDKKWMGWYKTTIFCAVDCILFLLAMQVLCACVDNDESVHTAIGPAPTFQWKITQTVFATSLIIDFVSWLWTVEEDKGRLFFLAAIVNGIPAISYGLLAGGYVPLLIDQHGRLLVTARYVHWLFTTPAMIFLYSRVSPVPDHEVLTNVNRLICVLPCRDIFLADVATTAVISRLLWQWLRVAVS